MSRLNPWTLALAALLSWSCGLHRDEPAVEVVPFHEATPEPESPPVEAVSPSNLVQRATVREVVEPVTGFGAKTIKVPVQDCKAVRSDPDTSGTQFPVPLPPFSEEMFPCTRCHDRPDDFNLTKRTLTAKHNDILLVHGPREQWCYGCHNPEERDHLRLAGGRLISFNESYQLCGQCHGTQYRDWKVGIHGRRTGCWNGKREYRLCVHCHSPHAPKFKPLEPRPHPIPPDESRSPSLPRRDSNDG